MSALERSWERRSLLGYFLLPLSWFYAAILAFRHHAYSQGWLTQRIVSLPVVVVGNISVGGTGKTPLCGYLVDYFRRAGWRPAVVSRGYGGARHDQPLMVASTHSAEQVGDEPLMLFQQTDVPVCVCVDRSAAVEHLARNTDANIVFSDDGLQHLKMPRVATILVVDGARGFGNRWLLPAGPLRDALHRVSAIDMLAVQSAGTTNSPQHADLTDIPLHPSLESLSAFSGTGHALDQRFTLQPLLAREIVTGKEWPLSRFAGQKVHAVAGIGHPQRFFDSLVNLGILVAGHPMSDHHVYRHSELDFADGLPVLVTAKDAVKITGLEQLPENVFEVTTRVLTSTALDEAIHRLEASLDRYK